MIHVAQEWVEWAKKGTLAVRSISRAAVAGWIGGGAFLPVRYGRAGQTDAKGQGSKRTPSRLEMDWRWFMPGRAGAKGKGGAQRRQLPALPLR